MRRKNILLIGAAVILISCVGDVAFSTSASKSASWSNYVYSWEMKWATPVKRNTVHTKSADRTETRNNERLPSKSS